MSEYVIRAANGDIIQRSHNLAGIRRAVREEPVAEVRISKVGTRAVLYVEFAKHARPIYGNRYSGAAFVTLFEDWQVLKGFVRRWRSVYGVPLYVNGEAAGEVAYGNEALR